MFWNFVLSVYLVWIVIVDLALTTVLTCGIRIRRLLLEILGPRDWSICLVIALKEARDCWWLSICPMVLSQSIFFIVRCSSNLLSDYFPFDLPLENWCSLLLCREQTGNSLGNACSSCILYRTSTWLLQHWKPKDLSWFKCIQNPLWWGRWSSSINVWSYQEQ